MDFPFERRSLSVRKGVEIFGGLHRLCATNAIAMRVMELPRTTTGTMRTCRSAKTLRATASRAGKRLEKSRERQMASRAEGKRVRNTAQSAAAMQQSSSPMEDATVAKHGYKLDAQDRTPSEGTGKQRKLVFVASEVRLGGTKTNCRANVVPVATLD